LVIQQQLELAANLQQCHWIFKIFFYPILHLDFVMFYFLPICKGMVTASDTTFFSL